MKKKYWHYFIIAINFIGDLFIVYLSFIVSYQARFNFSFVVNSFPITKGTPSFSIYESYLPAIVFIWGIVFIYVKFYKEKSLPALDELIQVVKGTTLATIMIMALTFLYREFEYSRLVIGFAWAASSFLIYLFHEAVKVSKYLLLRKNFGPERVLVIGQGKSTEALIDYLKKQPHLKVHYLPQPNRERMIELIEKKDVDEIIFAQFPIDNDKLIELDKECQNYRINLRFIPDILELRMGELIVDNYFGLPLLQLKSISLHGVNYFLKRSVDLFVSLLVISILLPFFLFLAVFIKLDAMGPVFYTQPRKGFRGRTFLFYKFRTMVMDAEKKLERLKKLSEREGPVFKMKDDPRVTRVGKFLRRYSLDELPQLLNVINGDMSLIGPRPQVLWEAASYDDLAKKRLNVLPGLTGLWQVSGRADLTYEEMIRLDIYYLENWSLGLDLRILLKTIPVVLLAKGAY